MCCLYKIPSYIGWFVILLTLVSLAVFVKKFDVAKNLYGKKNELTKKYQKILRQLNQQQKCLHKKKRKQLKHFSFFWTVLRTHFWVFLHHEIDDKKKIELKRFLPTMESKFRNIAVDMDMMSALIVSIEDMVKVHFVHFSWHGKWEFIFQLHQKIAKRYFKKSTFFMNVIFVHVPSPYTPRDFGVSILQLTF